MWHDATAQFSDASPARCADKTMTSIPRLRTITGPPTSKPALRVQPAVLSLLIGLAIGSVIGVALTVALAPGAAAETTLEVESPAGEYGRSDSGTVVLLVTVSADGAANGNVVVAMDGVAVASEPLEVPGGSSKTVALTVPASGWAGYEVIFDAEDEDDAASTRIELRRAAGDELVAVFPSLAARGMPDTADLTVDVGRARLFVFDPALLDLGREAIGVFGYAIVAGEDLDRLPEPAREALWSWVALRGGSLVLTGDPGDVALPEDRSVEFAPDDPRRAWLGSGSVLFAGDRLDDGYDGLLAPRTARAGEDGFWVDSWTRTAALARDAGVTVPPIGVLVIALVVYAILAGPLLWMLLRRSRREPLLWLALPLLAVLVTGVLYGAGRRIRESAGSAHASLVADVLGEQYRASYVLVTSPHGGSAGVSLAPGWSQLPLFDEGLEFGFDGGSSVSAGVGPSERGAQVLIDLDPGGFGVVAAQAGIAAGAAPSFGVTTRVEGLWLHVDVVNQSGYTLHEVVAGSSSDTRRRDDPLAPGETFSLRLPVPKWVDSSFGDVLLDEVLWGGSFMGDEFFEGDPVDEARESSPAIVADFLGANAHLRGEEFITVVGWTREPAAPLDTHTGGPPDSGSTALLTVARLDQAHSDGANRVTALRGYQNTSVLDLSDGSCSEGAVTLRILRVGGFAPDETAVLDRPTRGLAGLDVWNGRSWVPARVADLNRDHVIELPAAAVVDDAVHVRMAPECAAFGAGVLAPELRPLAADDVAVALGETEPAADTAGEGE